MKLDVSSTGAALEHYWEILGDVPEVAEWLKKKGLKWTLEKVHVGLAVATLKLRAMEGVREI